MVPSYRRLQQYAIGISITSILYNGAEGAVSVGFGSESASRSLVFFGVQSAIEVVSAAIVVWRFWRVARPGEEKDVRLGARELRQEYCLAILLTNEFIIYPESKNMPQPPSVCSSSVFLSQPRSLPSSLSLSTNTQIHPTPLSSSPPPPSS
jgi:hypothetical protein